MKNTKYNYIFLPDTDKGKPDGRLRLRIKWGATTVAFNVGYRVEFDRWSRDIQRCKKNTTHGKKKIMSSVINRKIQFYEDALIETFSQFEKLDIIPDAELLRDKFNVAIGKSSNAADTSFFSIYDKFVSSMSRKNNWTKGTLAKFSTLRLRLLRYSDKLTLESLDESGLSSYVEFLRDDEQLRNTTIAKQINFLKCFLRWAYKNNYTQQNAFTYFSPKLKSTQKKIIFLDWEELMTVYNFEGLNQSLVYVRDVFCFCCFTSLRYSDVANLRRSDIYDNHIEITTVKTADTLKIELNNYSREILARYENSEFPNNLALPIISNQKMNKYLKFLGEICGINSSVRETHYVGNERIDVVSEKWQLLSTHAGRRTFICNALMLGISPNVVMKWTGHSDYKAMKPYIDITDKAKEDAMSLFNR